MQLFNEPSTVIAYYYYTWIITTPDVFLHLMIMFHGMTKHRISCLMKIMTIVVFVPHNILDFIFCLSFRLIFIPSYLFIWKNITY